MSEKQKPLILTLTEAQESQEVINQAVPRLHEIIEAKAGEPIFHYWRRLNWEFEELFDSGIVPIAVKKQNLSQGKTREYFKNFWVLHKLRNGGENDNEKMDFVCFGKADDYNGEIELDEMNWDEIDTAWEAGVPISLNEMATTSRFQHMQDKALREMGPLNFFDVSGQEIIKHDNNLFRIPGILVRNPNTEGTIVQFAVPVENSRSVHAFQMI